MKSPDGPREWEASRLLVRATNWVGDAILSLPALRRIRACFPCARITVLAMESVAGLYQRESAADEIVPFRLRRGWRDVRGKWKLARELAARGFDAAIVLTNSFESAALVRAAAIPVRIGYARDGRGWLLTHAIRAPRGGEIPRHESYYYLELLRRAGLIETLPEEPVTIRLEGIEAAREAGRKRLAGLGFDEPVIGVSPGAAYGGAKRWLPGRFAEAAARIRESTGGTVAVFGTREEAGVCEEVAAAIERGGVASQSLAGRTTLAEFIDLAAACRVFLTNDSGSMHIASALAVPTIAVFGATDDVATGPTGELARVVRHPVECSPCLLRECPIDHRCMTGVSAREVAETALNLLK